MAKSLTSKQLNKANLSMNHFSRLIGVSHNSIGRYFIGTIKSEENIQKINIAAKVLAELDLVWPTVRYIPNAKQIKEYEKNKKKLDKLDKKFVKAYEKALKKAGL